MPVSTRGGGRDDGTGRRLVVGPAHLAQELAQPGRGEVLVADVEISTRPRLAQLDQHRCRDLIEERHRAQPCPRGAKLIGEAGDVVAAHRVEARVTNPARFPGGRAAGGSGPGRRAGSPSGRMPRRATGRRRPGGRVCDQRLQRRQRQPHDFHGATAQLEGPLDGAEMGDRGDRVEPVSGRAAGGDRKPVASLPGAQRGYGDARGAGE